MPTIKITKVGSKPIEQWTSRDILKYYSERMYEQYGTHLIIPSSAAWRAFQGKIKGFQHKLHLSNQQYRAFVDAVFDVLFAGRGFIPNFGAIVSERVFHIVGRISAGETASDAVREIYATNEFSRPAAREQSHGV